MKILENKKLCFLEEDILKKFGKEKGEEIYLKAEKLYSKYVFTIDPKGNEALNNHLITNLFPTMAYYKALRDSNYNIDDALSYVREETKKSAEAKRLENKKIPFVGELQTA